MNHNLIDTYIRMCADKAQRGVPTDEIIAFLAADNLTKDEMRLILTAASIILHDREAAHNAVPSRS